MYEYPYGGEQQLNLNWIISEIIKIHKTLDPDYVAPAFDNTFPFTNLNALNLDWILKELRTIKDIAPTEDATILKMVANALITLSYNPDNTYNSGDIAYHDTTNRLYICMFDETTGVWDDTQWDEFRVGEALTWLLTNPNATTSDNVSNESTVTGDNVTDALDTLAGLISGLAASNISNDSNVTGTTTKDALNNLNGAISDVESAITGLDSAFKEFHFYYDSVTINAKTALNVFPNNIGDLPSNYVIIGIRGIWTGATQTLVRGYVAATGEIDLTNTADTSQTATPNMLVLCIDKSVLASFF